MHVLSKHGGFYTYLHTKQRHVMLRHPRQPCIPYLLPQSPEEELPRLAVPHPRRSLDNTRQVIVSVQMAGVTLYKGTYLDITIFWSSGHPKSNT